jgi:hypothetical protein
MVIPARVPVNPGGPAKFGCDDDESSVEQPFGFEIGNQICSRDIHDPGEGRDTLEIVHMGIPSAVGHFDKTHSAFDQSFCEEAALAEWIESVTVSLLFFFPGKIKQLQIFTAEKFERLVVELGVGEDLEVSPESLK